MIENICLRCKDDSGFVISAPIVPVDEGTVGAFVIDGFTPFEISATIDDSGCDVLFDFPCDEDLDVSGDILIFDEKALRDIIRQAI